jgi:hypothetical protein
VRTQVLGVKSRETRGREAAKWREAVSRPSGEDRWQRSGRSRELGSSQGESPSIGYSKSRGREKREGNNRWIRIAERPLDPHEGSCIGASREKGREFGHGNHEVASSEIPRGKVSELTDHRVSGVREPSVQPLNS